MKAATVASADNVNANAASLALTGQTAGVGVSGGTEETALPGVADIEIVGYQPEISVVAQAGVGVVEIVGYKPTSFTGIVTPGVGEVVLEGQKTTLKLGVPNYGGNILYTFFFSPKKPKSYAGGHVDYSLVEQRQKEDEELLMIIEEFVKRVSNG